MELFNQDPYSVMPKHVNNLINETSPYLLQHAHNPVNWYAWNDEALQKAKKEDKPILVSIGYSACHWCHVMEQESFEDEETAQIMNRHFINIKVDREERPDVDHIYMDAVQAITGSGGWPLNVFLTPDLKPFFGGTYYPPVRALNRSSWKEVLLAVSNAYKEKRKEISEQAENLTQYLLNTNNFIQIEEAASADITSLNTIAENILKSADPEWGGFGQAPKFPQTFCILFLLRHSFFTHDENALQAAIVSLDRLMMGGIYDHLGGGFCRYSTDRRWQVPHFEKMLYDNALLLNVYAEAYQLTKKEEYAGVILNTISFIKTEMTSPENGFYSAFDADSEGIEGKYYTWDKKEIVEILGENSNLFCQVYDVLDDGNWENTNILWRPGKLELIAEKSGIGIDELISKLDASKQILLKERQKREKPSLDTKILLGWNALMTAGLCKAYAVMAKEEYLQLAVANIRFIEEHLFDTKTISLLHGWNKTANIQPAFLDDCAALIQAYIALHQCTADTDYLVKAKAITEKVIELFSDEEGIFFYFTPKNQSDILIRKTEIYDGATPSGNALMSENLISLSKFFNIQKWKIRSENMLLNIKKFAISHPLSFGVWALNLQLLVHSLKEIVILGKNYAFLLKRILQEYIPLKIIQATAEESNNWPLLAEKTIMQNQTNIYICKNYSCLKPAASFEEFKNLLTKYF